MRVEPTARSAEEARQFLRGATIGIAIDQEAVLLLASELVTNAVRHAQTPFLLTINVRSDRVRVAVTDTNAQFPTLRPFDLDSEGGLGMNIVNRMSQNWGTEPTESGKTVWFETAIEEPEQR